VTHKLGGRAAGENEHHSPSGAASGLPTNRVLRTLYASNVLRFFTTASISSSVVVRPKLNRIAPMPISGGTRIAFRTGESVTAPEWQAEPVEAATPPKPCKISAPTLPGKLTFSVFGSLSVGCPLRTTSWSNSSSNRRQKQVSEFQG